MGGARAFACSRLGGSAAQRGAGGRAFAPVARDERKQLAQQRLAVKAERLCVPAVRAACRTAAAAAHSDRPPLDECECNFAEPLDLRIGHKRRHIHTKPVPAATTDTHIRTHARTPSQYLQQTSAQHCRAQHATRDTPTHTSSRAEPISANEGTLQSLRSNCRNRKGTHVPQLSEVLRRPSGLRYSSVCRNVGSTGHSTVGTRTTRGRFA